MALHQREQLAHHLGTETALRADLAHQDSDVALERPQVGRAVVVGEVPDGPREHRRIGHGKAERDPLEPLERHRVEPADRAEVEQPEGAGGVDEDVARVRVGVVEAIRQDLAEHRAEEAVGELVPRDAAGVDRLAVRHGPARHGLHHQDAIGGERGVDGRDGEPGVVRPVLAQAAPDDASCP